ncbi:cytochrome P460 family protein [Dinghuibacter silviterrae]|uniref:Heme-binding protein n=1 Tax=Dinghuibacter silviterrae TaxID=1539049 RepID=A0A4R8DM88_9BACT|nr:cytochrome P460 family protein [Dinghuibacter silviterrae]TDW99089.1 heme-binding protein [Dinghuibacter silviterrae]
MKKVLIIAAVVGGFFGLMQLVRPEKIASAPVGDLAGVPKEVDDILRKSCFDCHSSQTNLRWYDQISPVNFLVYRDVRDGRKALDFSNWDSMATPAQNSTLYYALNKVLEKGMPLPAYTFVHGPARLSPEEVDILKKYTLSRTPRILTDTAEVVTPVSLAAAKPAPNGIAYVPGYRSWQVLNTSDRFDNGTLRIIFANDIAVKAIQAHQTNVWPDGTIFAKTAWKEQVHADGRVTAGAFFQVEFMIKDAKKYAKTAGWGWARWRGDSLKPYGANRLFATECVTCHQPMHDNDFVFTRPLDRSFADELPENPLLLHTITGMVHSNDSTMSMLYGNDAAFAYAGSHSDGHYPGGALLYEVTWRQQPDERWTGANIPERILSVERLAFWVDGQPVYTMYKGTPLRGGNRVSAIAGERMAVAP